MTEQALPHRGWYRSRVDGPSRERFWAGANWTVRVRPCGTRDSRDEKYLPVPTPTPPPPRPSEVAGPAKRRLSQEREHEPRTSDAANGGPRFIGDAELGGVSLRRMFDAACYAVSGIAFIVVGAETGNAWGAVFGIGAIVYGGKIALTVTSYWVTTWIYVIAIGAVVATFSVLGGG